MDLALDPSTAEGYSSEAQRSRVITETWAAEHLYCLNCSSSSIDAHRPVTTVEDVLCPSCDRRIQLKASRGGHGTKVANSAYEQKIGAIRANDAPDYAFMGFDPYAWRVTDLFVVPGHYMTPTVVEKRKPLSSAARRSGWVGSNVLLNRIPEPGRIRIVTQGSAVPADEARETFERTAFLSGETMDTREWTTAVMNCIEELPVRQGQRFTLDDVYGFEEELAEMYPDNRHIRAKIRQQLQVLRDQGVLEFLGDGEYRLKWTDDRAH